LNAEKLTGRPRHADHNRKSFASAIDTADAIAQEKFAPRNQKSDENEPASVCPISNTTQHHIPMAHTASRPDAATEDINL
jgi:hypothetical protein